MDGKTAAAIAAVAVAASFTVLALQYAYLPAPQQAEDPNAMIIRMWGNVHPNVQTSSNDEIVMPGIEREAFIHPFAIVIGNCYVVSVMDKRSKVWHDRQI